MGFIQECCSESIRDAAYQCGLFSLIVLITSYPDAEQEETERMMTISASLGMASALLVWFLFSNRSVVLVSMLIATASAACYSYAMVLEVLRLSKAQERAEMEMIDLSWKYWIWQDLFLFVYFIITANHFFLAYYCYDRVKFLGTSHTPLSNRAPGDMV